MQSIFKIFCVSISLMMAGISYLNAQRSIILGAGAGAFNFYPTHSTFAFSHGFTLSSQLNRNLFKLRFVNNIEFLSFSTPSLSAMDLGILYGRILGDTKIQTSISAGLSITGGVRRGNLIKEGFMGSTYQRVPFSAFGIPLEIQFLVNNKKSRSIGITGFGNLNKEEPFVGGLINWKLTLKKRGEH